MNSSDERDDTSPTRRQPSRTAGARRRRRRRILVASMVAVVASAFLTRAFVVETFRVRERSMWPHLLHERDRVFVDKTARLRGAIERFDVVAFMRDGTAYVKRVLSTGGETLLIRGGDVFVKDADGGWSRPPRSAESVEDMRVEIYPAGRPGAARFTSNGGETVDGGDGVVVLRSSSGGAAKATLASTTIGVDLCVRDDHPGADDRIIRGRNCVADVRVEIGALEVSAGASFSIVHRLRDEERAVSTGVDGIRITTIERGEEPRTSFLPVTPRPEGLRVETLDGVFSVSERRGGSWRTLFSEPRAVESHGGWSTVSFEIEGGEARLGSLVVSRDAHYVDADGRDESPAWFVPAGELFLVGDNVPVSVDSRTFGTVKPGEIVGKVVGVLRR